MSNDIDFDVEAARHWGIEVQDELMRVEKLLQDVSKECSIPPGEDDTIYQGMNAIGKELNSAWDVLCAGFRGMCNLFNDLVNKREEYFTIVTNSLENFKSSIHI